MKLTEKFRAFNEMPEGLKTVTTVVMISLSVAVVAFVIATIALGSVRRGN